MYHGSDANKTIPIYDHHIRSRNPTPHRTLGSFDRERVLRRRRRRQRSAVGVGDDSGAAMLSLNGADCSLIELHVLYMAGISECFTLFSRFRAISPYARDARRCIHQHPAAFGGILIIASSAADSLTCRLRRQRSLSSRVVSSILVVVWYDCMIGFILPLGCPALEHSAVRHTHDSGCGWRWGWARGGGTGHGA